jgi:hypothetical protein
MARRSGNRAGYVDRLGYSLGENNSRAAVPSVPIAPSPSPPPAAENGLISQEVIFQERMVEMAHMARMAAARPAAATATAATRQGGRSGEFEARPVTLSLRPGFHIRQVGLVLQFQGGRWSIGLSSADSGQSGRCFKRATSRVRQARQHRPLAPTCIDLKTFSAARREAQRARVVSVQNCGRGKLPARQQ